MYQTWAVSHPHLVLCAGDFDVIIGDLADPVYGGPCYQASDFTSGTASDCS